MSEEPKQSYYSKISLANKTPEEAERIKKLFEDNKNLAYKVATKYYKTKHWDYDEALQIAQMGLWKACLIWDPGKYRLSTLAYNIIHRDFMDFDRIEDNMIIQKKGKFLMIVECQGINYDLMSDMEKVSVKVLNSC